MVTDANIEMQKTGRMILFRQCEDRFVDMVR